MPRRRALALAVALCGMAAVAPAFGASSLQAPNVVEISPQLTTAGQPTAEALATLKAQGYGAVIYLVPPTAPDAVRDEDLIVGRQGLVYLNLPVRFDAPGVQDVEVFIAALRALRDRRVLVHCQVNMRASLFTFLYRVIELREDPRLAYEAVARVWTPDGVWKRLLQQQLRQHRIDFDPF